MGTGFWIIQAMLLVAAVATAVYVERENNHRAEDEAAKRPDLKVRIERQGARRSAARWALRAERASADGYTILRSPPLFSGIEQSRLLLMRRWVEEARAVRGRLYDDLAPDENEPTTAVVDGFGFLRPDDAAGESGVGHSRPRRSARWSPRSVLLGLGVLLLSVGCVGIWRTNDQMNALEQAPRTTLAPVRSSFLSHLVPGVISNPAKYLSAVNSSSGGSAGGQDPLEAMAMLALKQAMDRYLGIVGIGLALVMGSEAGWAARSPRAEASPSSIGSDLVPFIALAALFCVALSFFELP